MPTISGNEYDPRWYQVEYHRMQDNGVKRAVIVYHRRAGKSVMLWNDTIGKAAVKPGVYWYVLRDIPMCKRIIWDNIVFINGKSKRMLDFIPQELIVKKNDSELKIELVNGSIIKMIGSVEFDRLRGSNPIDIKFDEYQDQDPKVWDTMRPVLAENGGTATFSGTPKGKNHLWEMTIRAKEDTSWFFDLKTVEDTGVIPLDVIESEKRECPADFFDQEYFCKFVDGADSVFRSFQTHSGAEDHGSPTWRHGFDPAGHGADESALCFINEQTGCASIIEGWRGVSYETTAAKFEAALLKRNSREGFTDATGSGQALIDFIGDVQTTPYTFTQKSRDELLRNLQIMLESGRVKVHKDDLQTIEQLGMFRYEKVGDKVRIQVPSGKHDDRVMALALASWQFTAKPIMNSLASNRNAGNIAMSYYR